MVKSPFLFGKIVFNDYFINRTKEIERLKLNIQSGINIFLISPRRWGKSSLMKKVSAEMKKEDAIRFCFLDLFAIRSEEKFYEIYAREVLKASSTRWEEWWENGKDFLKKVVPSFSFGVDPVQDFSLSLDWEVVKKDPQEVLDLPERIAVKKGIKMVICIDEFQNIHDFAGSLAFQGQLRSAWQHHTSVVYCLYGSKRHVILQLFEKKSKPFYKFGDTMFLKKIGRNDWVEFIMRAFESTGKQISKKLADNIAALMQDHPYFVQQLAHQTWQNTVGKASKSTLDAALDEMLTANSILYYRETEGLTETQINFLKAFLSGVKKFNAKETLQKFELGTSGNIKRIKEALADKEILDFAGGAPEFVDPSYEIWFRKHFRIQAITG